MASRQDHVWVLFIGGHVEPDLTVRLEALLPTAYPVSEPGEGPRFVLGLDSNQASKTSAVSIFALRLLSII